MKIPKGFYFKRGFSLIELSLIILVLSFIAVGMLSGVKDHKVLKNDYETYKKIKKIKETIESYKNSAGYFLCPADGTLQRTDPDFGIEMRISPDGDCDSVSNPGNSNYTSSDGKVQIGILPVRSYGLSDDYLYDEWGNRITYAVTEKLVSSTTYAESSGGIIIIKDYNNLLPPDDPAQNRFSSEGSFLVISHGKDGIGAYNHDGTMRITASSIGGGEFADSEFQAQNHHMYGTMPIDNVFVKPSQPFPGIYFDDYINYGTKPPPPGFAVGVKKSGIYATDTFSGVLEMPDKGFLASGYSQSFTTPAYGRHLLVKYDSVGNSQWVKTIEMASKNLTMGPIRETLDGNYVSAGYFGGPGVNSHGIVTKFDESGSVIWSKTVYGGTYQDIFQDVVVMPDGDIIAVGNSMNWAGAPDVGWIMVKFSSSGTYQWARMLDGSTQEAAKGVTATADGGFVVVGIVVDPNVANQWGGGIAKYNSAGGLLWDKSFPVGTQFSVVAATSDGGVVAATSGSGGKVMKFTDNGIIEWQRTLSNAQIYSITEAENGDFILAGTTPFARGFIARVSSSDLLWASSIGGFSNGYSSFTAGEQVIEASNGDIVAVGSYSSAETASDAYIVKLKEGGDMGFTCTGLTAETPSWLFSANSPSSHVRSSFSISPSIGNAALTVTDRTAEAAEDHVCKKAGS